MQKKTKKRKEPEGSVPHRADVATTLDMGCRVTSRSIAYAAVQVCSCGHVQMELILTFACSFTLRSRMLHSGARSMTDLITKPSTGLSLITSSVDLRIPRSSLTGGMSKCSITPLVPLLKPPHRQIFPNAASPQDKSKHSAVEASMALLMEQEEAGSSGGSS